LELVDRVLRAALLEWLPKANISDRFDQMILGCKMVCGVAGNWTICWEVSSSLAWKRLACGYSIPPVGVVGSVEHLMGPIPKEDGK
jgi:hypothetical protein